MRAVKDLGYAIKRHPFVILKNGFTCFSVLFTIVKVVVQFFPSTKIEGPLPLFVGIVASAAWALDRAWKPSKTEFKVANCNTTIEILVGDIFEQDGFRAIAVGEFFESQLGAPVSDRSLHGVFLKRFFAGRPESFDVQIDKELANSPFTDRSSEKQTGKTRCYPIGTTAVVPVNDDRYILFALTKADIPTLKAWSDVELMWRALHKLWQRARVECGGYPLNLPLVGSGLSGLGLPTRDLLNLLILSAITETKAKEITQRIRIVLHRDRFEDLDLRDVKAHWEE